MERFGTGALIKVLIFGMVCAMRINASGQEAPDSIYKIQSNLELLFEDKFDYTTKAQLKEKWLLDDSKTRTLYNNKETQLYTEDNVVVNGATPVADYNGETRTGVITLVAKRIFDERSVAVYETDANGNYVLDDNGDKILKECNFDPYYSDICYPVPDPSLKKYPEESTWTEAGVTKTYHYTSGMLQYDDPDYGDCEGVKDIYYGTPSFAYHGFTYGYFEAEIALPQADGSFPAFWLRSGLSEIDIFEQNGWTDSINSTVINFDGPIANNPTHKELVKADPTTGKTGLKSWHKYGVLWHDDYVAFYLDGRLIDKVPSSDLQMHPAAMTIIFNMAIWEWMECRCSANGNKFDEAEMHINYIKVYRDTRKRTVVDASTPIFENVLQNGDLLVPNGEVLNIKQNFAMNLKSKLSLEQGGTINLEGTNFAGCPIAGPNDQLQLKSPGQFDADLSGTVNCVNSIIRVPENGTFVVKSTGVLNVCPNGYLIIEKNAKLIVENGGIVNFSGTNGNIVMYQNSRLELNGTINVENGTKLVADYLKGEIVIGHDGKIISGNNTELRFSGNDRTKKFLSLSEYNKLVLTAAKITFGTGIIDFKSGAAIEVNYQSAQLGVHGDFILNNVTLNNANADLNNRITVYGMNEITVYACTFNNMLNGLEVWDQQGTFIIKNSIFNGNKYGLFLRNMASGAVKMVNTDFFNNGTGIKASNIEEISLDESEMMNNQTGIDVSHSKYVYLLNNTIIHKGTIGVRSYYSNTFLRGASKIQECVQGILGEGSYGDPIMVSVGDDGSCGWLTNNAVGIQGKNIMLNIDAEENAPFFGIYQIPVPNHFEDNMVVAEICYDIPFFTNVNDLTVMAKGNYWGGVGSIQGGSMHHQSFNPATIFNVEPMCGSNLGPNIHVDMKNKCFNVSSNLDCDVCLSSYTNVPGQNSGNKVQNPLDIMENCGPVLENGKSISETFKEGYAEFVQKNYDLAMPAFELVSAVEIRDVNNTELLSPKCERMVMIAEILTEKMKGGGTLHTTNSYALEVQPNPVHGNFVATYDLNGLNSGSLVIKDAITGFVKKTELIDGTQKSKQLNVSGVVNGNYILEMQGPNGDVLNAKHFIVY